MSSIEGDFFFFFWKVEHWLQRNRENKSFLRRSDSPDGIQLGLKLAQLLKLTAIQWATLFCSHTYPNKTPIFLIRPVLYILYQNCYFPWALIQFVVKAINHYVRECGRVKLWGTCNRIQYCERGVNDSWAVLASVSTAISCVDHPFKTIIQIQGLW